MARKLPVISEAAAHVKTLTGGRMVTVARNLPVFIRRAPLDIYRPLCEATRRGEKDGCGLQAPSHIRGRRSCKDTYRREDDGHGSQALSHIGGNTSPRYAGPDQVSSLKSGSAQRTRVLPATKKRMSGPRRQQSSQVSTGPFHNLSPTSSEKSRRRSGSRHANGRGPEPPRRSTGCLRDNGPMAR